MTVSAAALIEHMDVVDLARRHGGRIIVATGALLGLDAVRAAASGSIVIVSSISGLKANIGNPAYAASKAGAISLTKTLGQAWGPEGIRVNGLAPGLVDTKLTRVTTQNPERMAGALATIPQRRAGLPADMAGAAIFLASPLASYVTGHTLVVDGGLSL